MMYIVPLVSLHVCVCAVPVPLKSVKGLQSHLLHGAWKNYMYYVAIATSTYTRGMMNNIIAVCIDLHYSRSIYLLHM